MRDLLKNQDKRRCGWGILLCIPAFLVTEVLILSSKSEEKNTLIFGLSAGRLILALVMLLCAAGFVFLMIGSSRRNTGSLPLRMIGCAAAASPFTVLLLTLQDNENTIFSVLRSRALPTLIFLLFLGILLLWAETGKKSRIPKALGASVLYAEFILIFVLLLSLFDRFSIEKNYGGLKWVWALSILLSVLSAYCKTKKAEHVISEIFFTVFLCVTAFAVIRTVQYFVGRINTPPNAYWGELAEAILHGHFYLEHPSGFHDLTFYNGQWYVPNPPLPGLLLIPAAAVLGDGSRINMTVYSALIGALNAGVVYLVLRKSDKAGLFRLHFSGILWLLAAFVFGGDHLWLSTTGQMWFISQLLVVTFTLLSVMIILDDGSPILAGICIGASVLCRPNVFPVYLCILGIWLYRRKIEKIRPDRELITWGLRSGISVVISVMLLLVYNYLRFGDLLDFGYKTINGAEEIVASANSYGLFSPHFFKTNLDIMLLRLPRIDLTGERFWFYPYVAGYSVLLMSPVLLYGFRNLRKNWWIIGSLSSAGVIILMLLLYHNTGAEQIGYRYILDASAPLILLVGNGMREKPGRLFKICTVFAVVLQLISIYWWYLGRI